MGGGRGELHDVMVVRTGPQEGKRGSQLKTRCYDDGGR